MRSDWKLQQSKLSTLILIISGHFLLVDSDDQDNDDERGKTGSLSLSVWEVYSDSVILDWFITLQNKHRFTTYCSSVPEDIISSIKSTRISINECSGNKDFFLYISYKKQNNMFLLIWKIYDLRLWLLTINACKDIQYLDNLISSSLCLPGDTNSWYLYQSQSVNNGFPMIRIWYCSDNGTLSYCSLPRLESTRHYPSVTYYSDQPPLQVESWEFTYWVNISGEFCQMRRLLWKWK